MWGLSHLHCQEVSQGLCHCDRGESLKEPACLLQGWPLTLRRGLARLPRGICPLPPALTEPTQVREGLWTTVLPSRHIWEGGGFQATLGKGGKAQRCPGTCPRPHRWLRGLAPGRGGEGLGRAGDAA